MIHQTKRVVVFIVGVLLLFLGVLGLVLPFLQGLLFIVLGLLLLSVYSPTLGEWIERQSRRHHKVHEVVLKTRAFIGRIIGEA